MAVQAATRAGVAAFVATSNSPAAEGFSEETGAPMPDDPHAATRAEVTAWFFEDYLPRWVAVAAGKSAEGPEFILNYWDTPMHVTGLDQSFWCLDDRSVLDFLELNHAPLRESGYSHTVVPDRRVIVYSSVGAAIEVIWSRRRADESEIERWAVHFELAKSEHGWRPSAFNRPSPQATAWKRYGLARALSWRPAMAEKEYPPLIMPEGVGRRAVTIWSNGIALDADVYRPTTVDADAALPAVALCHGWGGSKLTAERYAALFAAAGMITVTFTQGSWFGSGSPLQLVGEAPTWMRVTRR